MMDRPGGVAIATVIGTAAVVAPIWISIHLAWRESVATEETRVRLTAQDILHHTDEAVLQNRAIYYMLKDDHLPPCSPAEIDLMRSLDLTSTYVQLVGRMQGDVLICTSLGTTQPIPLGPAQLRTAFGADTRTGVRLAIAGNYPLNVLTRGDIAILYDPALFVDTPVEGNDISLAVMVPSRPGTDSLTTVGAQMRPEWLKTLPMGADTTFLDAGYIVCAMRSRIADVEVVVAAPLSYATRREQQFALIFVPIGLACAALLVWANVYISRKRLALATILRAAVRRREFYVEYQPIVELKTRRWVGAEALVRWRRGKRTVRPDMFIPIAEETGVITGITECVFEIVARDLPLLISADPEFSVAVNLSAADLGSDSTAALIERALVQSRARPSNLEVEATERGFLRSADAQRVILAIRQKGVVVAIDDFGTGYSSLSRLQELPLDVLKIDKSFVDTVGTDGVTSHVILHIIEMAQSLKLDLVAEGVESEEQASFLLEHGVAHAQGWLFARPMSVANICRELASKSEKRAQVHA